MDVEGRLSTYVDGYLIYNTPQLLSIVLEFPFHGLSLFQESYFPIHSFDHVVALSKWTGETYSNVALTTSSKLPDSLKLLHYFIAGVFLPRSVGHYLVTPMDTWIMHHAVVDHKLNYCSLMLATMAKFSNSFYEVELSFGPQISLLLQRLGIPLKLRYQEANPYDHLRPQHILHRIG
ncbi:hypothetical protein LINPERPRIM_LOCUS20865 [Linum perenne]